MNSKGSGFNELDMAEMIYIAYACAHPDEAIPEKNEFLMEITDSRQILGEVFQQLFGVQKKKQDSQMRLNRQQRRRQGR